MTHPGGTDTDGFSLIEALVALAVLAIATVGLVGAVEQHIDSTRAMEQRAAAMWVAENRLTELNAGIPASEQVTMLDSNWRVRTVQRATADPAIARVRVDVFAQGQTSPTVSLDGFLDTGEPVQQEGRR